MGSIDKHNYEAWLLDYHEGNLTAEQQAELLLFLESHPELKPLSENPVSIRLSADEKDSFPNRADLWRHKVTADNIDHFLIARLEGDLSPAEERMVAEFLASHPRYRENERLIGLVRMEPGNEVFPGKQLLTHPISVGERGRKKAYFIYAAAASVIVLLGAYYLFTGNRAMQNELASTETATESAKPVGQVPARDTSIADTGPGNISEGPEAAYPAGVPVRTMEPVEIPVTETSDPESGHKADTPDAGSQPEEPVAPSMESQLIREMLAEEFDNDPDKLDEEQFEAMLDRIIASGTDSIPESALPQPAINDQPDVVPEKAPTPLLDALAWSASRVSKQVALRKNYNQDGELVAYRFEAGPLKFGRKSK